MVVIDAHAHAWAPEETYAWQRPPTPCGIKSMTYTIENYRADMTGMGVDRAVLVATPVHGPGSPYTIDCVEASPETFVGVVLVEEGAPDAAEQVDSALSRSGIIGIRVTGETLTMTDCGSVFEAVARRSGQVHLLITPEHVEETLAIVRRYPEITFVIDHLGLWQHPRYDPVEEPFSRMAAIADCSNVYVKLTHTPSESHFPFEDVHPHVRFLVEQFGADRLVWGSDYVYHFKHTTPREARAFVDELTFLTTRERRAILGETLEGLLD